VPDPADPTTTRTGGGTVTRPPNLQLFNFLDPEALEQLLTHVAENLDAMEPSQVLEGPLQRATYNESSRRSRVDGNVEAVWPLLEGPIGPLFPHLRRELGTGWFELGSVERQLTVHRDGDFFTRHVDDAQPMTDGARMITYVYYFNAEPKEFEGGELRLFDTLVTDDGIRHPGETYVDIEPVSNSIVFFTADSFHEVLPVRQTGNGPGASRCTVNGWFHLGDIGRPRSQAIDHSTLTALAGRVLPRVTECGFAQRPTPATVQQRLVNHLDLYRSLAHTEGAPESQFPTGSPDLVPLHGLGTELLAEMHELHERWAGVPLRPVAAYGMRVFGPGCTQHPVTERPETHVISSMLVVETDLDTPWPLMFDLDGRRHELHPDTGQMVLYEGASTPQARPVPVDGRAVVVVHLHYCPLDWQHSTATIARDAVERGLIDDRGLLLPAVTLSI
jgi:hypothetical protein